MIKRNNWKFFFFTEACWLVVSARVKSQPKIRRMCKVNASEEKKQKKFREVNQMANTIDRRLWASKE